MFSDKLIALRKAKGLSQKQLAETLGISRSTISMYELGVREPNFDQINDIAKALDCTVAELIDDVEDFISIQERQRQQRLQTQEDELAAYLEMLRTRPEMRVLLDTVKGATKEEVEANVKFIEALRKGGQG